MSATRTKPPRLRSGDTVGVIAPAAAVEREHLERGVNVLAQAGFRVKVSERVLGRSGILAGNDRERARELHEYFADPEVRAIFTARGGYGTSRLLPLIDFGALARTPKSFVGFSDLTFLLNPLVQRSGFVAFHGPAVAVDLARGLTPRALDHLLQLLKGELAGFEFEAREAVHEGSAEGEVMGGCLSVLTAMLGTPYAPDFGAKILFLEDTGEKAYRVDRMLVQLRQAGVLSSAAAIVFGAIRPVDGNEQEARLLEQFIAEQTAGLGRPVLHGIEAGHGTENLALPLGLRARVETSPRPRLVFVDAAVS